jgi:hypothetical protein
LGFAIVVLLVEAGATFAIALRPPTESLSVVARVKAF